MARIIEAKAVISAEDRTGAVFDKIAKKIDGIAKSAKSSVAVDRLAKSMDNVQKQMAAIDRFGASRTRYDAALKQMRFLEAEAKRVDVMVKGLGASVDQKAAAAEQKRIASAADAAAKALDRERNAALAARRALSELGVPISGAIAHQDRLRAAVDRANSALERQPGRVTRAAAAAARGVGSALPFAGPAILHGTRAAAKAGAEVQSEIVKMRVAGIPEADIQRAASDVPHLTAKYTNVKTADALERFKELRSIVLHPEEAHELLPTAVAANSALNAMDKSGEAGHGLGFAFKGAEILGRAQDPEKFRHYMDAVIKARQVMGNTVTAESIYENAKYMRSSGAQLSDRYLTTTALSLAQEMGGSSAGVATDQFEKTVQGGLANRHAAAKAFVRYGLADADDFEKTKTGELKGMKAGKHVKDWRNAMENPDQWVWNQLLPALEKAGVTDQNEQIAEARKMFPGTSSDLVAKLITQRKSLENHAGLYGAAKGMGALDLNKTDPLAAMNSLSTSISNFAGTLTSPVMANAASVMSGLATSIGAFSESLASFNKEHPDLAKWGGGAALAGGAAVGGVATYSLISGLMTGFGLPASAIALDTSAAALSAAAAELSVAALGGKAGAVASGAAGAGAAAGGSSIWGMGARALPFVPGVALSTGVAGGLWAMNKSVNDAGYNGMTSGERLAQQRGGSMTELRRKHFLEGRALDEGYTMPELSPTMAYGTGVGGDKALAVAVTGEVHGEAPFEVKVGPGPELISIVSEMRQAIKLMGQIGANGPGSTGLSSPDSGTGGRPFTGVGSAPY
ncbi:Phage protein [Bradyrhizobium sp.]|uniref:hypothetical protein n=1 Tax=Bradyrhizobium sp. TaxID=376 RepID=UPI0007C17459|nr:hypothetical protein [Bradyrhizobium sp.]CUT12542.1 Phage protein [Bradyrhizobium sp.]